MRCARLRLCDGMSCGGAGTSTGRCLGVAQGTDHRGDGSDTFVGQLAAATERIVLGLNLLLGMGGFLVGLVLDEEHLGLAGGGSLLDHLRLHVRCVGLLAQHIDDGLVLVDGGADLDRGLLVATLWRLDEDHVVVALGHADSDVTLLVLLIHILGSGVNEEALRDNGLLVLLLQLLLMMHGGLLLEEGLLLLGCRLEVLLLLLWHHLVASLEEGSTAAAGRAQTTEGRWTGVVVVALRGS